MRVLMIGANDQGGHGFYCRTLAEALRESGVDVRLYGLRPFATPPYVRFRPLWAADRFLRAAANSVRALNQVAKGRFDIIHFQLITPLTDRFWIPAMARKVPMIITVHNVEPHKPTVGFTSNWFRPIYQSSDRLIVHSNTNMRRFVEIYPELVDKTVVIPHGAWVPTKRYSKEEARSRLGLPLNRQMILFFGSIRQNKGLGFLLEAIATLCKRFLDDTPPLLIVAGSLPVNESFEPYSQRIMELGIEEYVCAKIGFVPDEEVPYYFCASDVVALPYTDQFQAQSGVLMLAYGYGVPVVVTDVGSLGEIVREDGTGIVVSQRDPDILANALRSILGNPNMRTRAAQSMLRLSVEKYSWRAVAEKTVEVYEMALRQRGARVGRTS